jgi:hypothetical protein
MKLLLSLTVFLMLSSFLSAQKGLPPFLKSTNEDGAQPDSVIRRIMKLPENVWLPESKQVFTYGENGNKTETMGYYWDTSAVAWQQQIHTFHSYDENGNMTGEFRFALNPATDKWDTISNYTRLYINNVIYNWNYDNWDPVNHYWYHAMKGEYDYNETGDEVTYITFNWNAQESVYDSSYMSKMKMNFLGKDSTGSYYQWNTEDSNWQYWYSYDYYYDENNNDTLVAYHDFDNTEAIERSYFNENGFRLSTTSFKWVDNEWLGMARIEYIAGTNGKTMMNTSYYWDASQNNWVPQFQEQSYYKGESTVNGNVGNPGIRIFPNPASDHIQVELTNASEAATFEIYDINGKRVLQQLVFSNSYISVSGLSRGFYLYQLHDGNRVFRGKLVIR